MAKNGYTVMEIIAVVVIMSVLTAVAVPRLTIVLQRGRNGEAEQILLAIYKAQLEYEYDNGAYTNDIDDLDLVVPAPKNFSAPTVVAGGNVNCGGANQNELANMDANTGTYTLHVLDDSRVVCTPCPGNLCRKMGYSAF